MRRADQVGGLLLLVFGLWFAVAARQYPYQSPNGPGSGFLPFWLGLTMAALAAGLVVGATRSSDPGRRWLPGRRGLARLVVVVGATAAFIALMNVLGMTVGTVLFLVVLLRLLEGHGWLTTLAVAVGTAAVNWLVFTHWLRVPFPPGILGL
jgi:hypothetical protein